MNIQTITFSDDIDIDQMQPRRTQIDQAAKDGDLQRLQVLHQAGHVYF